MDAVGALAGLGAAMLGLCAVVVFVWRLSISRRDGLSTEEAASDIEKAHQQYLDGLPSERRQSEFADVIIAAMVMSSHPHRVWARTRGLIPTDRMLRWGDRQFSWASTRLSDIRSAGWCTWMILTLRNPDREVSP